MDAVSGVKENLWGLERQILAWSISNRATISSLVT